MPPFGRESGESSARSVPFLSLSHAPASKALSRKPPSKAFAAEGAEQVRQPTLRVGTQPVKKERGQALSG